MSSGSQPPPPSSASRGAPRRRTLAQRHCALRGRRRLTLAAVRPSTAVKIAASVAALVAGPAGGARRLTWQPSRPAAARVAPRAGRPAHGRQRDRRHGPPARPAPPADRQDRPERADRHDRQDRPDRQDRARAGRPDTGGDRRGGTGPTQPEGARRCRRRSSPRLQRTLARAMAPLGGHSGAYVVDLATGQVLYDDSRHDAAQPRLGREALHAEHRARALRAGRDARPRASTRTARSSRDGVFDGDLYLVGGGDPTFGDQHFINEWYGGDRHERRRARAQADRRDARAQDPTARSSATSPTSTASAAARRPTTRSTRTSSASSARSPSIAARPTAPEPPAAYAAFRLAGALRHRGVVVTGRSHAGVHRPRARAPGDERSPRRR